MMIRDSEEVYKPQTKMELAHAYGVTLRTITTWLEPHLEEIGPKRGRTYTPKQIKTIYELFGPPSLARAKKK